MTPSHPSSSRTIKPALRRHHLPDQSSGTKPETTEAPKTLVVGAAIVHRGQLFAAQRSYPRELRGKWELPGGKVKPGEDGWSALVRELNEELGWQRIPEGFSQPLVNPARIDGYWPLDGQKLMRVWVIEPPVRPQFERTDDHLKFYWGNWTEITQLDWIEADRILLNTLHRDGYLKDT